MNQPCIKQIEKERIINMSKKKNRNKALIVTAAACSIGFSGLGSATSAFAEAPKVQYTDYHDINNQNMNDQDRNQFNNFKRYFDYGSTISTIRDIHAVGTPNIVDAGSETLDNTAGYSSQKLNTPSTTIKTTDTLTTTHAIENAAEFGLTLAVESKENIGIVEETQKFTASIKDTLKTTDSKTTTHSDEKTYVIPSQSIEVPAGKKYKIEYVYKQTALEGVMDQVKEIREQRNENGKLNFPDVAVGRDSHEQATPNTGVGISFSNSKGESANLTNAAYDPVLNATPYQMFNQLTNMTKQAKQWGITNPICAIVDGSANITALHADALLNNIYLDHSLGKAYMVEESIPFKAATGHEFTLKVYDVTNGDKALVAEKPVQNAVKK